MRAVITGGTGFVGKRLISCLDQPVVLTRDPTAAMRKLGNVNCYAWNAKSPDLPPAAFEGAEVVFHLAGEPVAEGRWTAAKMSRIRSSRVDGTKRLVAALAKLDVRPKTLVSASAVGYYGDRGDASLTEKAARGEGFLADVCFAWEEAAKEAESLGMRVVTPRIGIVLGRGGGALSAMLTPFKLGVGGRLGSGKQWMPWIHIDDLVGLLLHAAVNDSVHGPMNAAAPGIVTNRDFTKALGRALGRATIFPVPGFALRLVLGGFADVLLASQRVVPQVATETGYVFQFEQLETALREIFSSGPPKRASLTSHDEPAKSIRASAH